MANSGCHYLSDFLSNMAASVLNNDTGLSLGYWQLLKHPKYQKIWSTLYSNELDFLYQGVGSNSDSTDKRVKGTDTFFVIDYKDIPTERRKEITYAKVVCEIRPPKADPNRPCIAIGGNPICYPVAFGTKTPPSNQSKW